MNFINKYFYEINFFFTKKLKYLFLFSFISGFAVNCFEIIGIGAIFYYIGIIISPFEYLSKYQNLYFVNYILNLDNSYRVFLLSIILVGIFWFKGIVIFLSNNNQYIKNKKNKLNIAFIAGLAFIISIIGINKTSAFIYFNF
jgi:hypothetical protein